MPDFDAESLNADNYDHCVDAWQLAKFWSEPELRPSTPAHRQIYAVMLAFLLTARAEIDETACLNAIDVFDANMAQGIYTVPSNVRLAVEERYDNEQERRYTRVDRSVRRMKKILATVNMLVQPDLTADDLWVLPTYDLSTDNSGASLPDLFRDLFPNPFRRVSFDPSWRTPTVAALAEAIYADRAWDRMPVLADALEEAGCGEARVLDHCRSYSVHARGCWVVDAVLGKT